MADQAALLRELMAMSQEERDAIVRMFNEVAVSEHVPDHGPGVWIDPNGGKRNE